MALTQRQLVNQTEKVKRHYEYLLDEYELRAGEIERRADLIRAHLADLECKDMRIPSDRKGKLWAEIPEIPESPETTKKPRKTRSTSKGSKRTRKSIAGG